MTCTQVWPKSLYQEGEPTKQTFCVPKRTESKIFIFFKLQGFWNQARQRKICIFNCLPFIFVVNQLYKLKLGKTISILKDKQQQNIMRKVTFYMYTEIKKKTLGKKVNIRKVYV